MAWSRAIGAGMRAVLVVALVAWAVAPPGRAHAADADLEIGGPGAGKGTFSQIRDLAFDAAGRVHVLDGGPFKKGDRTVPGNFLVQRFAADGKFLSQFSVYDESLAKANDPARLAVDSRGNVYVTQPAAGVVQQFSPDGKLLNKLPVPRAMGLAVQVVGGRERVLVAARPGRNAIDELDVIEPSGLVAQPLKLSRKLVGCDDLATDAAGNIYAHAETLQVYKFDPTGKHLLTIGAGTRTRIEDGGELWHGVTVDAKGTIYSMAGGQCVRFDPALTTVTLRKGQFTWYDPWSPHMSYTALAVAPDGRIWLAASGYDDGKGRYHKRPVVVRTVADFFETGAETHSALLLGLTLQARPRLACHVGTRLDPVDVDFVVKPGARRVKDISVSWQAVDTYKAPAARGTFDLKLTDGVEARKTIRFTPPRWGWYAVEFQVSSAARPLTGIATFLGLTPEHAGLPVLKEGTSPGGWEDPLRQAFVGLPLMRIHPRPGQLDKLEKVVTDAKSHGVTPLAQFTGKKEATDEFVTEAVRRFKGRIRYWEIINEPNFSFKPADYVALCKRLYAIIKKIDPSASVLAPAVCGVQLPWYKAFYEAGGARVCDVLSLHDYEGHESIDPFHWRRKFADLRKLTADAADADKPVWQTERGIPGVRADTFLGPAQAVRELLHRNLLAELGIASDRSLYYYLNDGGYGAYPAYLWSREGPHPGALALRTRRAMLGGMALAERIDLGATGKKCFLALRYATAGRQVVTVQNLGTVDAPMDVAVSAGEALAVVDAFGNAHAVPVRAGAARITVGALPIYLRPAPGQKIALPKLDLGRNLAALATFSYSGQLKRGTSSVSVLANGVFESPHAGYPTQYKYLEGKIERFPQYLDITFPRPRAVSSMLVFSLRADNMQTALLDFDVEARDGERWLVVDRVRTPLPTSSPVRTLRCKANTWYLDTNFHHSTFEPVTSDRFRLVIRRTTRGLLPDEAAEKITGRQFGPRLHLREVEIYGPPRDVEVRLAGDTTVHHEAVPGTTVQATFTNRSRKPIRGEARIQTPGLLWVATPVSVPVDIPAGGSVRKTFEIAIPGSIIAARLPLDVALRDAAGKVLDEGRCTLTFRSPVEMSLRPPPVLDANAQPMLLALKNVGPKAVSGTVKLTVGRLGAGLHHVTSAPATFGPIAPGATVTARVVVPGLKLLGRAWHVTWMVTANGLRSALDQDWAPVQAWSVAGAFANDEKNSALATPLEPERKVDLAATYAVAGGKPIRWRTLLTDARGYVELAKAFERKTFACAYAAGYLHSPTARKAVLSLGWDESLKVFLHGKLLATDDRVSHGAKRGELRLPVSLRRGVNEVLLKVTQFHGGWGFYFDVLTPDGKPMADVAVTAKPRR